MYSTTTKIRVRYSETDKMGYVYYGNYAQYYEVGRTEMFRELGFPYKKLEDDNYFLPVAFMNIKFIKAALYDDLLTLKTTLVRKPLVKLMFKYEIYNSDNELLNQAETTLVFVDGKTRKPCKAPDYFLEKLEANKSVKF